VKRLVYILIFGYLISSCGGNKKNIVSKQNKHIVEKYASILKTSKTDIKNVKLYSFIESWFGTKYKYGGMSKTGIDCSGFCNLLYKQVYNKQISRTTSALSKEINKVSKNNLKEGNLVFFNISKKKNSHVGVYLKNKMFVHASSSKGVIISSLENPYYKKVYNKGGKL
jgi:cell wall-associated NlpC family hydrolase